LKSNFGRRDGVGALNLESNGATAQRRRCNGATAQRRNSATAQRRNGATAQRRIGASAQRRNGASEGEGGCAAAQIRKVGGTSGSKINAPQVAVKLMRVNLMRHKWQ